MTRLRILFPAALLLALAVFVPSSSDAAEKVLKMVYPNEPATMDTQLNHSDYMVPYNIFDRLVEKITDPATREPKVVEGLAKSWTISEDGIVYTFKLRDDAKFHDGSPVKANDVIYTFERILDPKTKSIQTDGFDMIKGAPEKLDGKAERVSGLKLIDDYTVEITLRQFYAPFLEDVIATPVASIYSEKFTTEKGDKFGLAPEDTIGSGPFILDEWVIDSHHELKANKSYWRDKPDIDRVRINVVGDAETARMMFEAGDIDIFDCDVARSQIPYFEKSSKWKNRIVKAQRIGLFYCTMNTEMAPFDDVRVRKAFMYAVPRKELLDSVFYGKGVLPDNILPKGTEPYNPSPKHKITYDPKKSKKMLEDAGYKTPVQIEISYSNRGSAGRNWAKMAEIMQAMLPAAGFEVKINQMDEAVFTDTRNSGKMMCYTMSWSTSDADPYFFKFFHSDRWSTYRSINTKDPKIDKMIHDARVEVDPKKRVQMYRDMDDYLTHDIAVMLPLFNMEHLFVVSDKVLDFVPNWKGWGDCMLYWTKMK